MTNINKNTPMCDLTIGGNIYNAGNAKDFKTGDWRSITPIFHSEKCKQCGLCFPVCPENSIPVNKVLLSNFQVYLFFYFAPHLRNCNSLLFIQFLKRSPQYL